MKKIFALLLVSLLMLAAIPAVSAANVTYTGNSGDLIFAPGSEHSPTDLFTNFKGVMPGDSLTQAITVKNDANKEVKVKIYMRSLGAHEDSVAFLSQLGLRVEKSADNEMAYMFDAAANETAQLTDWVCLGTLYSGGEVNLNVILDVPVELDNQYQYQIGYLDWEFMIEEYPVEPDDPKPPVTGDSASVWPWIAVAAASVCFLFLLWLIAKRRERENN